MKAKAYLPVRLPALAISVASLLASTPSPSSAQAHAGNQPFIGLWKLNVEKSRAHVRPGFALYRKYEEEGDGWIFETVTTITPGRGPQFLFTAARFDGSPYPDYTAKWLGNFVRYGTKPPQNVTFIRVSAYEIQWTDRVNGRVVASGAETVSENGKVMTMTDHVPGQKATDVQVFDRVSGPGTPARP